MSAVLKTIEAGFEPMTESRLDAVVAIERRAYTHPWTRGSYASYGVGQWTTLCGAEREPVGRLYFAGEHCSLSAQGFMEGGCETGEAAAAAILREMGATRAA